MTNETKREDSPRAGRGLSDAPSGHDLLHRLRQLDAEARLSRAIVDTHHTRDYAGRTHGFLRVEGELVPIAAFVLNPEGMTDGIGRARLELAALAFNHLPQIIAALERVEGGR